MHGQPSMLRHDRCHLRQLDPLGHAHEFGRKISVQGAAAARAAVGPMIDDRVGIIAHHAAMALVAGLGPARSGLLAPLFAVCGGRLRGRARGLVRTLQTQHQLDQFLPAQPLKIAAPHPTKESAKPDPRKGLGNYGRLLHRAPQHGADAPVNDFVIALHTQGREILQTLIDVEKTGLTTHCSISPADDAITPGNAPAREIFGGV